MSYIEQTQQGTLWCDKKYLKYYRKSLGMNCCLCMNYGFILIIETFHYYFC